jgi:sterol 3beta-glucosyltransferase
MHYAIVAIGSRGDVQPYIALALGLMNRGHTVTVLAHENFKEFVEGYGVGFWPLSGSVEKILQSEEGLKVLRSGRILSFVRYLQKLTQRTQDTVCRDIFEGCQTADVLVASLLAIPWVHSIAEKLNKKWAIVQVNLPTTPTAAFPLPGLDFFDFRIYNRLTYRFFELFHWKTNKRAINQFRKSLGLEPLRTPIFRKIANEKILNLHCFSPALRARPDDWSSEIDITGFLFLSKPDAIPEQLTHWMNRGDAPVYIGLGSIPIPDPERFARVIRELLTESKERFIFCRGWSPPIDLPNHPRLFQLESVNHEWLFPLCKTVIIHGGIGTTAAALKAKAPPIILSVFADQPWWGKIIERRNLGIHIPFKKMNTQKLMDAIKKTQALDLKNNVLRKGQEINSEQGLRRTIDALEYYFSKNRLSTH